MSTPPNMGRSWVSDQGQPAGRSNSRSGGGPRWAPTARRSSPEPRKVQISRFKREPRALRRGAACGLIGLRAGLGVRGQEKVKILTAGPPPLGDMPGGASGTGRPSRGWPMFPKPLSGTWRGAPPRTDRSSVNPPRAGAGLLAPKATGSKRGLTARSQTRRLNHVHNVHHVHPPWWLTPGAVVSSAGRAFRAKRKPRGSWAPT